MADWATGRQERQKRAAAIRAKLKKNGQTLLGLIREGIVAKLPEGSEVVINPDQVVSSWSGRVPSEMAPMLAINGYPVGLTIEQHHVPYSGGTGHYNDRLAVGVNWIWVDYDVKHKSKSFRYSAKSRQESFGFDVAKIVDYILWWVNEKKRHEAISRSAKRQKAKAEDVRGQWDLAKRRVEQHFDIPGTINIEATPSGLKVTLVTDERHLETLLEAMGVKRS
jgi:hypothetical protein